MRQARQLILLLIIPSIASWWVVESILLNPYTPELLPLVSALMVLVLSIFTRLECGRVKLQRYPQFATLIGTIICAAMLESNPSRRDPWSQQSTGILQVINFIQLHETVKKAEGLMVVLPLYALIRLAVDAFSHSNVYALQSIQSVLLIIALVVTSKVSEQDQDQSETITPAKYPQILTPRSNLRAPERQLEDELIQPNSRDQSSPFQNLEGSKLGEPKSVSRSPPTVRKSVSFNPQQNSGYLTVQDDLPLPELVKSASQHRQSMVECKSLGFPNNSNLDYVRENNSVSLTLQAQEKRTLQISIFISNILNNFPQGILLVDQDHFVTQMNDKCERLLDCWGKESVLTQIKTLIMNSKIITDEKKQSRMTLPAQKQAEEIIRMAQSQGDPNGLFKNLMFLPKQNAQMGSDHHELRSLQYAFSSLSESNSQQCSVTVLCEHTVHDRIKQLKITLVQGYLPKLDQEDEVSEPILMVLIKNITVKKRLKNLQVESQFQNMLLQSFSHELRTPLNCSNQMLTVAQDLIKGDLLLSKLIRQAMASNLLLIYQLNDILDFAALECDKFTYKWDTMNWGLIIEEINELYRDACQDKNLDFEIIDNTNDEQIKSDKNRVLQALVNFLNNSIKFTPQNGTITLTITIKKIRQNRYIKFSVIDNGIGVEQPTLKSLQNHFRINKNMGVLQSMIKSQLKGSIGLGLNLANKLIAGLTFTCQNFIKIKSKNQLGTRVSFLIEDAQDPDPLARLQGDSGIWPVSPSHTKRKDHSEGDQGYLIKLVEPNVIDQLSSVERDTFSKVPHLPPIIPYFPPLSFSKIIFKRRDAPNAQADDRAGKISETVVQVAVPAQILIVDDVPFNHLALKAMFSSLKILTDHAYDGSQAIQMVQTKLDRESSYYQLILMDIEMPQINGFEATKQILAKLKDNRSRTCIVMCSAYDTTDNYTKASACGMRDILPKPIRKMELMKILTKYCSL